MAVDRVTNGRPEYETMQVADLRIGRRGKHYTLVSGILQQLENLAHGSALIIPLDSIGEMSVADLRSAVTRATRARQISIKTYSDEKNFFIWKKLTGPSKRKNRG